MFGASPSKPNAWVTMAGASRNRVGSVWTDSLPARPPEASKAGIRSGAARTLISATIPHASSRSDRSECSLASSRTRDAQRAGSFFQTSTTIVGLAVAPTAPKPTAYSSSSTAQLSFQTSVGVSDTVRASGLAVSVCIGP